MTGILCNNFTILTILPFHFYTQLGADLEVCLKPACSPCFLTIRLLFPSVTAYQISALILVSIMSISVPYKLLNSKSNLLHYSLC